MAAAHLGQPQVASKAHAEEGCRKVVLAGIVVRRLFAASFAVPPKALCRRVQARHAWRRQSHALCAAVTQY